MAFIKQLSRLHINTVAILTFENQQKTQVEKKLNKTLNELEIAQEKRKENKQKLLATRNKLKKQIDKKNQLLKKVNVARYSRQKANKQLLQKLEHSAFNGALDFKRFRDYKGKLSWPMRGVTIRRLEERRSYSWEIRNKTIMPVYAIALGKVEYAGRLGMLGKVIIINHGGNYRSIYQHLGVMQVKQGQAVRTRQIISQSGKTGGRERYGIVFELRHGRKNINFSKWLESQPIAYERTP